jgi:hypothetical protein
VALRQVLIAVLVAAWAAQAAAQAIYTCVDAKGRRLTADRPIAECLDREQRELNPSGTVRRKVGPSLTAVERAAEEEKARIAAEEQARADEEKKRERALLVRYPNQASHDKERTAALSVGQEGIAAATKRLAELVQQRSAMAAEAEPFSGNLAKMPPVLKRRIEDNEHQQADQKRFLSFQATERQRLEVRFNDELARLKPLWIQQPVVPLAAASSAKKP